MAKFDDAASALVQRALEQSFVPLPPEGPILGFYLRPGPWLDALPAERLVVLQPWQPHAAALAAAGVTVVARRELLTAELAQRGAPQLVLGTPHQGRAHTFGLIALGLELAAVGAPVLFALPNALGPATYEKSLRRHAQQVEALSKFKARAFALLRPAELPAVIATAWPAQAAERAVTVEEHSLLLRPGLFSAEGPDPASEMLLAHLPAELGPVVCDLGCGWGFLAHRLLERDGSIQRLHLVDADAEALDLAERNCAPVAGGRPLHAHWCDVAAGVPGLSHVDSVVMNPPFHDTGATDIGLGQAFIRSAARMLKPGGRLVMVANRQLPYEAVLEAEFQAVDKLAEAGGFKVLWARKAG